MNWNEKLQTILDYVEEHLQRREEPINKNEIDVYKRQGYRRADTDAEQGSG